MVPANSMVVAVIGLDGAAHILSLSSPLVFLLAPGGGRRAAEEVVGRSCRPQRRGRRRSLRGRGRGGGTGGGRGGGGGGGGTSDGGEERWWSWATVTQGSATVARVYRHADDRMRRGERRSDGRKDKDEEIKEREKENGKIKNEHEKKDKVCYEHFTSSSILNSQEKLFCQTFS
jgi:hypothetical protein